MATPSRASASRPPTAAVCARAFVPGADASRRCDASTASRSASSTGAATAGFFEGRRDRSAAAASAQLRQRRRRMDASSIPTASGRCSGRWTTTTSPRARISGSSTSSAPTSIAHEGVARRPFRRLGAERAARLGRRRFQSAGTAAATSCATASTPACGRSSFPSSAPARVYKFEIIGADGGAAAAQGRPLRASPPKCGRRPPRSSPTRRPSSGTTSAYLDGRGATRPAPRADLDLRGPSRLVAAARRRQRSSPMTSLPTS